MSSKEEEDGVMEIEDIDPSSKTIEDVDDDEMDVDTSLHMLCCRRSCNKIASSNIECRTCRVLMIGRENFCSEECLSTHISQFHDEEQLKKCATLPIPATPSPVKKDDDVIVLSNTSTMEEELEEMMGRDQSQSTSRKERTPASVLREAMENMKLESSGCCPEKVSKSKCTRWINGVRVQFPHEKPHKNQMFLMIQTIDALINRGHAALESPTGTGKTAALLCAALAWHSTFEEKRKKLIEAAISKEEETTESTEKQLSQSSTGLTQLMNKNASISSKRKKPKKRKPDKNLAKRVLPPGYLTKESKPCRIFYGTRTQAQVKNVVRELKALAYNPDLAVLGSRQFLCACKDELKEKSPVGLPLGIACMQRIRHKASSNQDGVMDESKDNEDEGGGCQYYQNLEEIDFARALFERSRSEKKIVMDLEDLSNFVLCNHVEEQNEESEEKVSASDFSQSCPYFSSQVLMGDAHLVVCPYNYILDPGIREAMGIDLNDSAVILDEAHNMSGVCRDAGSIEIKLQQLLEMEQLCCVFSTLGSWMHDGLRVSDCAKRWVKFLERVVVKMLQNDNEVPLPSRTNRYADPTEHAMSMFMSSAPTTSSSSSSSTKRNMIAMNVRGNVDTLLCSLFDSVSAAEVQIEELRADACTMFEAVLEKPKMMKHVPLLKNLNHLSSCLSMLYHHKEKYVSGYLRLELDEEDTTTVKSISKCPDDKCSRLHADNRFENVYSLRNMQRGDYRRLRWVIWLMDASVTFGQVARDSHSVVLASGTLHPMDALLSELGSDFNRRLRRVSNDSNAPVRLRTYQGMHVLKQQRKQLWVAAVGCGPLGQVRLNGSNRNTSAGKKKRKRNARDFFNQTTYRKTPQTKYYEEIGHAIVGICEAVPDGVVVFVPSYAKLKSMVKCWKKAEYSSTSMTIWQRLSNVKLGSDIIVEPRNTISSSRNNDEASLTLEEAHKNYASGVYTGDGALMLAVFRGKMSEGMDLKDSMVRCAVCVGIPYPNCMDLNVRVKMTYNDIQRAHFNFRKANQKTSTRLTSSQDETYFVPLDGWSWYRQSAFQAVNQAVGRVHRHPNDYGAIILLDDRYNDLSSQAPIRPYLSRWYRDVVKRNFVRARFGEIKYELSTFFAESVPSEIRVDGAAQCARDCGDVAEKQSPRRSHITPEYDKEHDAEAKECSSSATSKRTLLEEEKKENKDDHVNKKKRPLTECVICLDSKANHAFIPCGHLCICADCIPAVIPEGKVKGPCPVCRAEATVQQLFFC